MAPVKKNETKGKSPKACDRGWWKLSDEQRKKHNDLMRIQLLSPFLFSKVYQEETWIEWAKSAGLLSQKRIGAMDDLTETELLYTDLVEVAINYLQEEIKQHKEFNANVTDVQFLEEIIDNINACEQNESLQTALEKVKGKHWFKTVRLHLSKLYAIVAMKLEAAVFLAAWQVSTYMKAVSSGEKLLETYKEDSTIDENLGKSKIEGNKFYANEEFSKAISKYTAILYAKPYIYIIYGNRAACYLKKKEFQSALSDGRRVTTLNPSWQKGQYRYAQALHELGRSKAALDVLSKAIKLCKNTEELETYQEEIQQKLADDKKTAMTNGDLSDNNGGNDDEWEDDCNWKGVSSEELSDCSIPDLHSESEDESDNEASSNDDENKNDETGNQDNDDVPALISDSESNSDVEDNGINQRVNKTDKKKIQRKAFKDKMDKNFKTHYKETAEDSSEGTEKDTRKQEKLKKKRKKKTVEIKSFDSIEAKQEDLQVTMKEGTIALLANQSRTAALQYGKAMKIIEDNKSLDLLLNCKKMVLHYAHGISFYKAGTRTDLVDSLKIFISINTNFGDKTFALSHFGIGQVYCKQNRFKDAQDPLRKALALGAESENTLYTWPGCDDVIEESIPLKLREAVTFLLSYCLNPPKPDAICRYSMCKHTQTIIYFSDPDFKGFVRLICTEKCFVEFHSNCWKRFRSGCTLQVSEKDFLKDACKTPDCIGVVNIIQIYEECNGNVKAEFKVSIEREKKRPYVDKRKRLLPSSELGYQKKIKKYNERMKRKEQKKLLVDNDIQNNNADDVISEETKQHTSKHNETSEETSKNQYNSPAVDGEMYVLKNKYEDDVIKGGKKKIKTKKAAKQKVTIEIPFIENEKKKQNASRMNNGFGVPSQIQEEISLFEEDWQKNDHEIAFKPYIIDNKDSIVDGFDFSLFNHLVPNATETALHLFSMFEQILEMHGSANIHTDKEILDFYNILDDNSKLLITEIGGLRTFLLKCNRFSFDKKRRDVVYLTSQEEFYEHCQSSRTHESYYSTIDESTAFKDIDLKKLFPCRPGSNGNLNPKAEAFVPVQLNSESEDSPKIVEITDSEIPPNVEVLKSSSSLETPVTSNDKKTVKKNISMEHYKEFEKKLNIDSTETQKDEVIKDTALKSDKKNNIETKKGAISPETNPTPARKREVASEFRQQILTEIIKTNETVYSGSGKNSSGFALSESVDYEVIQNETRENVNMTSFKHSSNSMVYIISDKDKESSCRRDLLSRALYSDTDNKKKSVKKSSAKNNDKTSNLKKKDEKTTTADKKVVATKKKEESKIEKRKEVERVKKLIEKSDKEPLCVGEAGVQVDLMQKEMSEMIRKKESLQELNKTLLSDLKSERGKREQDLKVEHAKIEKLKEDLSKQRNKYATMHDRLQSEVSERKKLYEKLKKESVRVQQGNEHEIKKLSTENKDLTDQVNDMKGEIKELLGKQERFQRERDERDGSFAELKSTLIGDRRRHQQEKSDLEEIVQRLTNSQSQQTQRAQKVEIALLEVKKDVVTTKYRDQATIIQNTLNQMQFWPRVPDAHKIRLIWEEYKKNFQTCFEKMQEEFLALIQAVKDGQPLEKMPPAKYAEPPPYPKTPMMQPNIPAQLKAQQMQIMAAAQQRHRVVPVAPTAQASSSASNQTDQVPLSQTPVAKLMVDLNKNNTQDVTSDATVSTASATVSTASATSSTASATVSGYESDSEDSENSSGQSDEPKPQIKMMDRIIMRLGTIFQNFSRDELEYFAYEYRRRHGSLSGMRLDEIVSNIERMIRTERQFANQSASSPKQAPRRSHVDRSKPLYTRQSADSHSAPVHAKRVRAHHVASNHPSRPESWLDHPSAHKPVSIFGHEEPCVICYEDMTRMTALKLHCGHVFHRNCITCWLNEQRTCPVCRVFALLPDEYPALG